MSQSFVQIYVHIVFHTKNNVKLIRDEIENELFSYIGGILKNYKSIPLQIGGTSDHIHILCTLPKTMTPADLAEEIKKSSSKWIKTKGEHYRNFYWQDGYGGFSVSKSGVDSVINYILNQKKHHEKVLFIDEYKTLLKVHGISYEDRYL
jgi:REP element-mobilizing transposase RayT